MLHPTPLKIHTPRRDMPGVLAASPPLTAYPGSHQKCESRVVEQPELLYDVEKMGTRAAKALGEFVKLVTTPVDLTAGQ